MSQADELLNSLTDEETTTYTADAETEPHIVIDSDRYITVPDELKVIAVQRDHNVETVTFDCPRYWDEHDLSTMLVYVKYLTAGGILGQYRCPSVTIDTEDFSIMHFTWTISGNVTAVNGTIAFLVCVKRVDTDGNEVTHWNSHRNTEMKVAEGLDCNEGGAELEPDIVSQLFERMDAAENSIKMADTIGAVEYYVQTKALLEGTQEVHETILTEIAVARTEHDVLNARIDAILGTETNPLDGWESVELQTYTDNTYVDRENTKATLYTNGINAVIHIERLKTIPDIPIEESDLMAPAESVYRRIFEIPEGYEPIGDTLIFDSRYFYNQELIDTSKPLVYDDLSFYIIRKNQKYYVSIGHLDYFDGSVIRPLDLPASTDMGDTPPIYLEYALKHPRYLDAELEDARVGQDGVAYDNLGEAIRTQFANLYEYVRTNGGGGGSSSDVETRLAALEAKIAELMYTPITFTSRSISPATVEMGSTVNSITLDWILNKDPVSQSYTASHLGQILPLEASKRSLTATGTFTYASNPTWTLTATDEKGKTATATAKINFVNGVYYGVAYERDSYTNDFIKSGLTRSLQATRAKTFTVNAGSQQYIYYAVPKRHGECTFTINGFDGGFYLVDTIDYTNSSGYTEQYYIYRSNAANLGTTKVTVS